MSAERPTAGARFIVERAPEEAGEGEGGAGKEGAGKGGGRVVYRGAVHLPDADIPLEVYVELPSGATRASLLGSAPPSAAIPGAHADLEKAAAALVRAATKAAVAGGTPLPRKIVRWRG